MTDVADEKAAIIAFLNALNPSIGMVNDRPRPSLASYRYPTSAASDPVIGWDLINADLGGNNPERRSPLDVCTIKVIRTWTLKGFFGIDDALDSENVYRNEYVERVLNALTPTRSLSGTVLTTGLPQLVLWRTTKIQTVALHVAAIELQTMSEVDIGSWV